MPRNRRNLDVATTETAAHLFEQPSERVAHAWSVLNNHARKFTGFSASDTALLTAVLRHHVLRDSLMLRIIGEPEIAQALTNIEVDGPLQDRRLLAITSQVAHMLAGHPGPDPCWWQNVPEGTRTDNMLEALFEVAMTSTPQRLIATFQAMSFDIESDLELMDLDWDLTANGMIRDIMLCNDF